VSYLNLAGTFYDMCSVLNGCSRSIVHWEIREVMKEADVETILKRAREKYPGEHPRIITDNAAEGGLKAPVGPAVRPSDRPSRSTLRERLAKRDRHPKVASSSPDLSIVGS